MRSSIGTAILSFFALFLLVFVVFAPGLYAAEFSSDTEECIGCHEGVTPGIYHDWLGSRHSRTTPGEALKKPELEQRISVTEVPESLSGFAVGCYECHSLNPEAHTDNFEHMGYKINVVVSPEDCRICHAEEVEQYSGSKKALAIGNLMDNPVYKTLVDTVISTRSVEGAAILPGEVSDMTRRETCLGCHGTKVEVKGMKEISTEMGEMMVPDLTNWPNQGVGRQNPDGSLGACTACHPRHGFSIKMAQSPYTCAQCHLEPDVPAWNVYKESKHGNIYFTEYHDWDLEGVPWVLGEDFKAPSCAVCHNSLVVSPDGETIAPRTHDFGKRLWVRLFGLIYSHAQPRSGDTTVIKNKDGLPLPLTFTGEPASEFLIDQAEQDAREAGMKRICGGCHGSDWVNGHFAKMDGTIEEVDKMTLASTLMMVETWKRGVESDKNPFDETIEKMWVQQWLFYANSIKYASAMTGAPDYASFKLGWWEMSRNLQGMKDTLETKGAAMKRE